MNKTISIGRSKEIILILWVLLLYFVGLCGLSLKEKIFTGKWIEIP